MALIPDNGQAKQQECHSSTFYLHQHPGYLLPAEFYEGCIISVLTLSKSAVSSEQPMLIRVPVPTRPYLTTLGGKEGKDLTGVTTLLIRKTGYKFSTRKKKGQKEEGIFYIYT